MGYGQERKQLEANRRLPERCPAPMALCWEFQAAVVLVAGQLRNWIIMKRQSQSTGYTVEADLKVQRTMKRAEWTAFCCLFRKIIGPKTAHADSKRIIDGLSKTEMKCNGQKTKDAELWMWIREEMHRNHRESAVLEVTSKRIHQRKKKTRHDAFRTICHGTQRRANKLAKDGASAQEKNCMRH